MNDARRTAPQTHQLDAACRQRHLGWPARRWPAASVVEGREAVQRGVAGAVSNMHLLLFALLIGATPPSPASFKGVSFYDEAFAQALPDEALVQRGWPTLEFPSRGVVVSHDGEAERFTFTAKPDASGFVLTVKGTDGRSQVRFWRWLDADRAATDLWGGVERIASRKKTTPADRRDAYGITLASRQLTGAFNDKKGLVFAVQSDGGVQWGPAGRGTFFTCQAECSPDAGSYLCLGFEAPSREYMFQADDAGVVARPVRTYDACGAREVVEGESIRRP